ncbi:hypothetical protein OO184_24475 [Photorhabdus sp. APURE]|uniref:hypothetical protein n=1 Tax=Photorhabdus aballayi TaxID=2991723 RepID=UPI00223DDD73|nr:hypothetical protein [Photorhabdus aballayi]MCW7550988.1 hypothetical protein [Photorhabdus aballayi]
MDILKREDAEVMLYQLLKRTVINDNDINELMDIAKNHDRSIPMKGIRHKYDHMEKRKLTKEDWDVLDTLMHFYGP